MVCTVSREEDDMSDVYRPITRERLYRWLAKNRKRRRKRRNQKTERIEASSQAGVSARALSETVC